MAARASRAQRVISTAAAFVAVLALMVVAVLTTESRAQTPETLHLLASPVDDVMPVLYAQRAGLFARAGLNVVLDRANNGGAVAAAIAGSAADIGKGDIGMIIGAHAHDVPLVIVAPAAVYDPRTPDCVLMVPASSPIRSPRDLVGKTIGVASINSVMTVAIQAWLDASGVSSASTQFVEIPYSQMAQALARGRVDATTPVKPFIADAVASGDARVAYPIYSAISSRFLESVWFANRDFVAKHQGAIAAFARTVAQASTYTNAHQAETVDLLSTWANIDRDRASRMQRIVTGSTVDARDIQPVIDAYATYKLIAKPFAAREIMLDR